jgi:signal transduction histidine kinase
VIPALRLRTLLLLSHVLVLALPALALIATGALRHDLLSQTREDLEHQADLLGLLVRSHLEPLPPEHARAQLPTLGAALRPILVAARESTLAGVRVVDDRGVVIATSGDELGENLSHRVEVQQALRGLRQVQVRPRPEPTRNPLDSSSRRAEERMFLGVPLLVHGETIGAVVLSRTPREEMQALYRLAPAWVLGIPIVITGALSLTAAQVFSRSLRRVEGTARHLAEGALPETELHELPVRSRVLEVRHLAQALGTTADRLRERLAYIGEFAGNVSHEFKTPISTLRGTVELLRDDDEMPAEQRNRFLDNALAELDHLQRLIGGLLALARAEEHTSHEPLDLDPFLRAAAHEAELPLTGSAGWVDADPRQLHAVLDNLVDNALLHGGPGVTVRIEAWRDGAHCGFDVVDDGPGVSPANLPRVFDRFFTTRRGRGGTGLGLALVRAICRAHGGDVELTSRPGETRARCRLPRARR